jgi:hypothetical protein
MGIQRYNHVCRSAYVHGIAAAIAGSQSGPSFNVLNRVLYLPVLSFHANASVQKCERIGAFDFSANGLQRMGCIQMRP